MKKISLLLLGALISMPAMATDYEDYDSSYDEDSYVSYDAPKSEKRDTYVGLRMHSNRHISFNYKIKDGNETTVHSNNFGWGLNIGNRLTDNVKIEFETLYTGASENKDATDFDYRIWSNMLNMYLYKNFGGAVEPYLGLGLGPTCIWVDVNGANGTKDDDCKLSFAVMTGINFALNKYVDLNLGLRYIDYDKMEFINSTARVRATEMYIGAAYKFGIFN